MAEFGQAMFLDGSIWNFTFDGAQLVTDFAVFHKRCTTEFNMCWNANVCIWYLPELTRSFQRMICITLRMTLHRPGPYKRQVPPHSAVRETTVSTGYGPTPALDHCARFRSLLGHFAGRQASREDHQSRDSHAA